MIQISATLLLKRLRIDNREFVTSDGVRDYCKKMKIEYDPAIRYFVKKGYFLRIFKGIFYIRPFDELELGRAKYNHLELVAKGLELKNVTNWYFGLHTALKLNSVTHEHFSIEEVVSDKIFRARPMKIAGHTFRFIKLSSRMLSFGVVEGKGIRYSDLEKTILDFAYLWRYNGVPVEKIAADISEWAEGASRKRLTEHAREYPSTVRGIIEMISKAK